MSTSNNHEESLFDIDDDLQGVDDFTNEPNPFESPFDDAIRNDTDDAKVPRNPPNYGSKSETMSLPPAYDEAVPAEQPNNTSNNGNSDTTRTPLPPGLLNYYSQYFQLNPTELKQRLYEAVSFKKKSNVDEESNANAEAVSDLYGPVWVTATIIMSIFVGNGLFSLVADGIIMGEPLSNNKSEMQFLKLVHSIWLFYVYVFLVPMLSFKLLQKNDSSVKNVFTLISIYGYSNLVWIPIGLSIDILNGLQNYIPRLILSLSEWALVGLAFGKSSLYLFQKLANTDGDKTIFVIIAINAIFCILVKLLLF